MWEVITEQIPFLGYDKDDLYQKIVVERYRPELPKNISADLADIILSCWNSTPEKRPSFDEILNKLYKLER